MTGSDTQTCLHIDLGATYQLHLGSLGAHSVAKSDINLVKQISS